MISLIDLRDPGARAYQVDQFRGLVVRRGGQVRGFVDACPHTGQSLSNGSDRYLTRDGARLLCLNHGAVFDLEGLCLAGPCLGQRLEPWPVTVVDGVVTTT